MGLYDNQIEPFIDLRSIRSLPTRKGGHVGTNLEPELKTDVQTVLEHIQKSRQQRATLNGRNSGKRKLAPGWTGAVQYWLRGDPDSGITLTASQLCDVFSFMLQDSFWQGPGSRPDGFRRNAGKMWLSRAYTRWSVFQKRPTENRPHTVTAHMPDGGETLVTHMAAAWQGTGAEAEGSADLWRPIVHALLTGSGAYGIKLSVDELRSLFDYVLTSPYYNGRAWDPEIFARSARQIFNSTPYQRHLNEPQPRPLTPKKRITLDEATDDTWEEFYS
jgi:hypothetical protein